MATIDEVATRALRALIPPPRLQLSAWIEDHICLPDDVSAQPGPVRLWSFQREIADAIGDPSIERVTLVKPVRVGFTTLLTAAVGSFVVNDPAPILCLQPAQDDCRDYMVSDIEPIFAASASLIEALGDDQEEGGRNTMLSRRFVGGSLKVVAAKAPRNLRRHNVRVLFIDEADGMEMTAEGSPILLAEKRTLSFPNRKIVMGSTPVHEETSQVLRSYARSDARVFEVTCPSCGAFEEILWEHMIWDEGAPETARWCCPHCKAEADEGRKSKMVAAGQWRATRPEIEGHAGFRLNALVSLHANASWPRLVAEFLSSKDDPATLQTFVNTILGQGWRGEGDELDDDALAARGEPFGLEAIPEDVLTITVGCDVQHDRLELTFIGWSEDGAMFVLGHRVIWGAWDAPETWTELDGLLNSRFQHALGGKIGIDAAAIDAGDGTVTNVVKDFARARWRRRVIAIKGAAGSRPLIELSKSTRKAGSRLFIVGVDTAKTQLFNRLCAATAIRLSADLPRRWHEEVASERVVTRYRRGQPTRRFERIPGRRAEALDCAVYALAARQIITPNWAAKRQELETGETVQPRRRTVFRSKWMER